MATTVKWSDLGTHTTNIKIGTSPVAITCGDNGSCYGKCFDDVNINTSDLFSSIVEFDVNKNVITLTGKTFTSDKNGGYFSFTSHGKTMTINITVVAGDKEVNVEAGSALTDKTFTDVCLSDNYTITGTFIYYEGKDSDGNWIQSTASNATLTTKKLEYTINSTTKTITGTQNNGYVSFVVPKEDLSFDIFPLSCTITLGVTDGSGKENTCTSNIILDTTYKWFIYNSEDKYLSYTYELNCNGLSGSNLSGHYVSASNCHGLANVCGDVKNFVPVSSLNISVDGNYYIGSTKVTSNMIRLVPCNSPSTHFGIYTTNEFANAVDSATSNFDITVPFKVSYKNSPVITFNLQFYKTDYAICPTAIFGVTEINTSGESTVFSNRIIIENWNGVTDYNDWNGGNNLKLEFYDSSDNKMDDSGFIINEISNYVEAAKIIPFSLKLTDSIVTITNKLELRLICTSSNTVLSTLKINQNFGYFVIAFHISTSLINNFTNAILNLITDKGVIELAGINQYNINNDNMIFYKFIKPVFELAGYNNCTTVNCRFSVSVTGQYTPSISLNGSSIDNKSVSINTCANISTIYTINVNLNKN